MLKQALGTYLVLGVRMRKIRLQCSLGRVRLPRLDLQDGNVQQHFCDKVGLIPQLLKLREGLFRVTAVDQSHRVEVGAGVGRDRLIGLGARQRQPDTGHERCHCQEHPRPILGLQNRYGLGRDWLWSFFF